MKKTRLIPVVAVIAAIILFQQRDTHVEPAEKTETASGLHSPPERALEKQLPVHGGGCERVEPRTGEEPPPSREELGQLRHLVAEIMQKNDLSPGEKQDLNEMMSIIPPSSE